MVINKKIIIKPVYGVNVTITPVDVNLPVFLINKVGNSSTIQGLKILGAITGICLDHSNKNQILGNNITTHTNGIKLDTSNNNVISGNSIINNENGIIMVNCLDNTISANNITRNTRNGITQTNSVNNTIYSNNIMKNGIGISLTNSPGKIIFNQITGNTQYGLYNTGKRLVNATNNWWGTNKPSVINSPGASADICNNGGTLNYDPYLVLTLTTSTDRSDRKNANYNYIVNADLNQDNHGKNTIPEGTVPDKIPINFATNLGTLSNSTSTTKRGKSSVLLKSTATGTATLTTNLDTQTQTKTLSLTPVTTQTITNTRTHKTYNTIQEAIDDTNTRNGDIITLGEGTYTENIIINKKITITTNTNKNVTVRAKHSTSVFVITHDGSGSIIQNLNIISSTQSSGISLSHSYNCIIRDNTINEASKGIYLYMSGNNTITGNNVTDGSQGIIIYKSTGNSVSWNIIVRNEIGLVVETSTFNIIKWNTIQDNYYGSRISDSNSNSISSNKINGNYVGIYLYNTNNNLISGNILVENGVGITNCNAIEDTITNTNTFKDSYLSDKSIVDAGDMVLATTIYTCGPAAFATVYNHLGGYTNEGEIAQDAKTDETGTSLAGLKDAATKKGMPVVGAKNVDISQLKPYNILVLNIDDTNHFVVYLSHNSTTVTVFDPNLGKISMNMTQFNTFYDAGSQTVFILNTTITPPGAIQLSNTEMSEIKALWRTIRTMKLRYIPPKVVWYTKIIDYTVWYPVLDYSYYPGYSVTWWGRTYNVGAGWYLSGWHMASYHVHYALRLFYIIPGRFEWYASIERQSEASDINYPKFLATLSLSLGAAELGVGILAAATIRAGLGASLGSGAFKAMLGGVGMYLDPRGIINPDPNPNDLSNPINMIDPSWEPWLSP